MSLSAKREYPSKIHGRYGRAGRAHKTRILDEFCLNCGIIAKPRCACCAGHCEHRQSGGGQGQNRSTTKPGILLRRQVPTRGGPPDTTKPGAVEVDTVAHCGDTTAGDYN